MKERVDDSMLINKNEFMQCAMEAGFIVNEDWLKEKDYVDKLLSDMLSLAVRSGGFLGAGIGRSAFALGNYVLKVARSLVNVEADGIHEEYYDMYDKSASAHIVPTDPRDEGFIQNRNEVNWYTDPAHKHYLSDAAAVYACSDNYAIELVERCEFLSGDDYDDMYNEETEIGGLFEYYNCNYCDIHEDNVALNRDGKLVIVDLGWEEC